MDDLLPTLVTGDFVGNFAMVITSFQVVPIAPKQKDGTNRFRAIDTVVRICLHLDPQILLHVIRQGFVNGGNMDILADDGQSLIIAAG